MSDQLYHHGILGMKWGVRRSESQLSRTERKDVKWVKKNQEKIQKPIQKAIKKDIESFVRNELSTKRELLKSGKLSKEYINAYNQKLASLMNNKVGDLKAPSGRLVRFVAKRGEVGVYTALADQGYNMDLIKRGIHSSGRVAYKKDVINRAGGN